VTHNPIAFLSYAAVDNRDGSLNEFREELSRELEVQTGIRYSIFQDTEMRSGDLWPERLAEEFEKATFFIAILTPSYFKSVPCREEVTRVYEKEKRLGRSDLIIPIYYVDSPPFNDASLRANDPLAEAIASRQYADWRELRFESLKNSPQARRALARLASDIRQRMSSHLSETQFSSDDCWRIERLSLKNFRCFEDLELNFRRPSILEGEWTCIAGINGAGKTSILQAICIGLLGERAHELGGGLLGRMRREGGASGPRTEINIVLSEARSRDTRTTLLQIDEKGLPRTQETWSVQNSTLVVAYGSTRNLASEQDTSLKRLSPEVQRMSSLFFPLAQLASAEVLLSDRRRIFSAQFVPLFTSLVRQVFERELEVLDEMETLRFAVMGKDHIEALDLPDGFRSSAAWLADLCAAWCAKQPEKAATAHPEDIEAIVLIDEIDLHLHPSLQRELVPRLRKVLPKVQWIVTTHSPLVLANFDANEIVALDRDCDGNVRRLDRQILGFSSDQIYQWLMGTQPTGEAIENILQNNEARGEPTDDAVAELLDTSPRVSEAEARERMKKLKGTIERLKP